MSKKIRWARVCAGMYRHGNWSIEATEGEFRCPGYTWITRYVPDDIDKENIGETFHGSLKAAKAYAENFLK